MNHKDIYDAGWHALHAGHLSKGIQLMDHGRYINHHGSPPLKINAPLLTNKEYLKQRVNGGTLAFNCEAGIGDQIANIRFVTNFASHFRVIVICDKSLWPIFRNIDGVSGLITKDGIDHLDVDFWVPSMSAPGILGLGYSDLKSKSYIETSINCLWSKMRDDNKLNIGIRWYGSSKQEDQQRKRFPPQKLFELANLPNVKLFSLQRDDGLELLPKDSNILDLSDYMSTWDRTLKLMSNMDLIISCCTSIAHLGGALGIPTWVITPKTQWYTWIYPEGNTTAWYDSIKLYRQSEDGDWSQALNSIQSDVKERNLGN